MYLENLCLYQSYLDSIEGKKNHKPTRKHLKDLIVKELNKMENFEVTIDTEARLATLSGIIGLMYVPAEKGVPASFLAKVKCYSTNHEPDTVELSVSWVKSNVNKEYYGDLIDLRINENKFVEVKHLMRTKELPILENEKEISAIKFSVGRNGKPAFFGQIPGQS